MNLQLAICITSVVAPELKPLGRCEYQVAVAVAVKIGRERTGDRADRIEAQSCLLYTSRCV